MDVSSPPIDIVPPSRFSSQSPGHHTSNLTFALQKAGSDSSRPPADGSRNGRDDSRPAPQRQDTLGLGTSHSAARPINGRHESVVGSYLGKSWGGMSLGSWLQDDIMMGGTSPYNPHTPSFHSSSYLPKMEAQFWTNLKCCDMTFNDLHSLTQHYEDVHAKGPPSMFPQKMSVSGERLPRRKSSLNPYAQTSATTQIKGFTTMSDVKANGTQNSKQDHHDGFKASMPSQDIDSLDHMEMDDELPMQVNGGLPSYQQQSDAYSQNPTPRLANVNTGLANMLQQQRGYQGSNPATPVTARQDFSRHNNPMVSSVNTPRLDTSGQHQDLDAQDLGGGFQDFGNSFQWNTKMLQQLNADMGNLEFNSNNTDMGQYCIDEPGKALYSAVGGLGQDFGNLGVDKLSSSEDAARKLQSAHLAGGMGAPGKYPNEEERPFRCPVVGCEKSYKNANGLRYHEKHGHSTQKLKENANGTFSIVDPVTSEPYPGTLGMEKEKPYRCEVCGKRYKNLNGLKYHRNHSPPCNPDFTFNNVALPGMQTDVAAVGSGEPIF